MPVLLYVRLGNDRQFSCAFSKVSPYIATIEGFRQRNVAVEGMEAAIVYMLSVTIEPFSLCLSLDEHWRSV